MSSIPSSDRTSSRGWLGWRIIRVSGRSMAPLLADGDHVLLKHYGRFRRPRSGDVACIARNGEPMLIKRLGDRAEDGRFRLSGDAASSAPSVDLGLAADHEIVGQAVVRISGNRIRLIYSRR